MLGSFQVEFLESAMASRHFRSDLDFYEKALAEWARFSVKTCPKLVRPNSIGSEEDDTLSLLHDVGDGASPIKCRNGRIVRILRLDFGTPEERTVH